MQRIKHSRSTLAAGISALVWLGLLVIGIGCFQVFLFPVVWPDQTWFAAAFAAVEAALCLAVLVYAVFNIRRNETFVCVLEDGVLQCVCPRPERGDSFTVPVDRISRFERLRREDGERWYVVDSAGSRHWLTTAYGNPAEKFVREIGRIRPELVPAGGE